MTPARSSAHTEAVFGRFTRDIACWIAVDTRQAPWPPHRHRRNVRTVHKVDRGLQRRSPAIVPKRSRDTATSTGPTSVSNVLARLPWRELPPLRPVGAQIIPRSEGFDAQVFPQPLSYFPMGTASVPWGVGSS